MTHYIPNSAPVLPEVAEYVREAFYAYETIRDQRDEALTRVQELTDERDRARATAVALEQENAEMSQRLARIAAVGRGIRDGDHATKGRDFGRGMAFAADLIELAEQDGLS